MVALYSHPSWREDAASALGSAADGERASCVFPADGLDSTPAMAATLLSAWLVAAQSKQRRKWGFWIFIVSNLLWAAWGWHDRAYALIALQVGLAFLNVRGVAKNEQ